MTRNWQELFGRVGDFNARIEENVGGIRVVQAFANEDHERDLFARDNAALPRRPSSTPTASWRRARSLSYLSMRLIAADRHGRRRATSCCTGELTDGGFVGFLLLVGVFFRPVEKINAVLETYPEGHRRLPALHRAPRHRARYRRRARRAGRRAACAATSASRASLRLRRATGGPAAASTWRSAPARRSPSSGPPARARRRSARCCRASTR